MLIITGASSGVGQFLFTALSPKYPVTGTYYSSKTPDTRLHKVDVTSFEDVERFRTSLPMEALSKLILINCAGININAFAHKADPTTWEKVIRTNLIGSFNMIRSFLPLMREQGYGRIINMGSVVSKRGVMGTSAYAASKAALEGLSKAVAAENAGKGITINTINLGYCDVGMGITQITDAQRTDLTAKIPAGRFGKPEEIASTVEYLISNGYCNGTSIDLNGALT